MVEAAAELEVKSCQIEANPGADVGHFSCPVKDLCCPLSHAALVFSDLVADEDLVASALDPAVASSDPFADLLSLAAAEL